MTLELLLLLRMLRLLIHGEALDTPLHSVLRLREALMLPVVGSLRGCLLAWHSLATQAILQQNCSLSLFSSFSVLALALHLLSLHGLRVLLIKLVLVNLIKWTQRSVLFLLVTWSLAKHGVQLLWCGAWACQLLTTDEGLFLIEFPSGPE